MRKHLLICLMFALISGCAESAKPETADVDLTLMSSTMMIATIDNIYARPDEYLGKTIKMRGQYYPYNSGRQYHYVMYFDEASCCNYGFEFIVSGGDYTYPGDYPNEEATIEVTGEFKRYRDSENSYYRLAVDGITVGG